MERLKHAYWSCQFSAVILGGFPQPATPAPKDPMPSWPQPAPAPTSTFPTESHN